jgi:regulatory protein
VLGAFCFSWIASPPAPLRKGEGSRASGGKAIFFFFANFVTLWETKMDEQLEKARKYCAYEERCQQQVRDKLYDWELHQKEVEQIISQLISEGFINEERFARTFARGKFRIKKWGRVKIKYELKKHRITDYCIKSGLQEIDEKEYIKTLQDSAEKKSRLIKEKHPLKKKYKLMTFLVGKGFENDLVRGVVEKMLKK